MAEQSEPQATNSDDTDEATHRREWHGVVAGVRRLVHATTDLNTSETTLADLSQRIHALANEMDQHTGERALPVYSKVDPEAGMNAEELNHLLPFSPVTGRLNPLAAPLRMSGDERRVVGEIRFDSAFQGAPGFVHGAVVAGVYDEILAMASVITGRVGPTVRLSVTYRKPTRLNVDLRFEAWLDKVSGRKLYAKGACYHGDELVSEGEALFLQMQEGHDNEDWAHVSKRTEKGRNA